MLVKPPADWGSAAFDKVTVRFLIAALFHTQKELFNHYP